MSKKDDGPLYTHGWDEDNIPYFGLASDEECDANEYPHSDEFDNDKDI